MSGQNVQDHYSGEDTGSGMAARILAALRSVNGSNAAVTPEALAPLDHFNARGVAATQELVALLEPQTGETILDIGSGIGGPARWIAARHGCTVTGVDMVRAGARRPRILRTVRRLNRSRQRSAMRHGS
jgi:sarcosine/dimethylglycine N-methyltransferase